jgi:hypothetical protein
MNRILSIGIAAAVALTLDSTALARGHGGGGGGGFHGGGGGFHGGGGRGAMVARGGGARFSGSSMGRASVAMGGRSFAPNRSVTPSRSFAPTTRNNVVSNRSIVSQPRSFATTTGRRGLTRTTPSVALGGHGFASTDRGFNNGIGRVPDNVSRGWDHGHEHSWNHHHFRFFNGAWILWDGGYPYWYDDYGYENPYDYDDYPDYYDGYTSAPAVSSDSLDADVQNVLAEDGYYHGDIDGIVGPQTRSAIAAFQRDHRLNVTGSIDNPTLSALGIR